MLVRLLIRSALLSVYSGVLVFGVWRLVVSLSLEMLFMASLAWMLKLYLV